MPTPVVVAAVRTPQGRAGGVFADLRSEALSIAVIDDLLAETDLTGEAVDDLLWGCAQQRGEQDNNLARVIALCSALGETTPAATINRWCASSMQAIISAADAIAAGNRDCVVAGGVESMSRLGMETPDADSLYPALSNRYDIGALEMGRTAETVATGHDVSRDAQDAYAVRSHHRAAAATRSGRFDDEIVPIETDDGVGVDTDEGIRPDTSADALAALKPAFVEGGTVTAGNASQLADGAAGVVVTSEEFADEHGLSPLARIGANAVAGVDPRVMGIGPVPATRRLLDRTGRTIDDYGLIELNEAFASQTVHATRELEIDDDRLNVTGGAIALGHPLGASGARLPVTLLHEMERREVDRGLATLCVGFGQGAAIEFRRS